MNAPDWLTGVLVIHIVSACFPVPQHFLKHLSKLNAILGKYPKSSKIVNKGKNIAIGGNITDTTQDTDNRKVSFPNHRNDL